MGKIHDRLKASAQRLKTITVGQRVLPAFDGKKGDARTVDTARQLSAFIQGLDRVRGDRSLDTVTRHYAMQRLADEATKLKLKGRWNLLCNRTQCLRTPATWYNRGSYAYYCEDCARDLNRVNWRDAEQLLGAGERLCIEVATGSQAEGLHVMP